MNQEEDSNFGSWRDDLNKNDQSREAGSGPARRPKSVDGFVSKEGFVIKDESQIKNQKSQIHHETIKTPPPPPTKKPGCSKWIKILVSVIIILLTLSILWLLFFYKSTIEISVSQTGTKITLDNKSAIAGLNKIKPGEYEIKIEKEGFVPYSKRIEIKYFKKTTLAIILKEMPAITSIYEGEANYLGYNKEADLYLFYVPAESAFYRVSSGAPILTTPNQIKNVVDVIWNPDRLTAILKIKNDNTILAGTPFYKPDVAPDATMTFLYDFGRYDLLHQEAHFWGTGIGDIEFTPKGDQVAYYFEPGTGEKSLVVANKDNSAINRIAGLRNFVNPTVSWSSDLKNIVLVNKSTAYETNKVFNFSLIEKVLSPLTETGDNLDALFDPSGEKIVYATYSSDPDFSNYSLLSLMDKDGQNKKELKARSLISQTTVNQTMGLLALSENEKDKYQPISINLADLKKIEYVFSGEIIAPTSLDYLESKNSIIFIDQNRAKILFLTTKEYE